MGRGKGRGNGMEIKMEEEDCEGEGGGEVVWPVRLGEREIAMEIMCILKPRAR